MHHYNPNEIKKTTNHFKTFSVSQSCVKFKISKTKNLNIFLQLSNPWSGSEPKTREQHSEGAWHSFPWLKL